MKIKNTKGETVWVIIMVVAGLILAVLAIGLVQGENKFLGVFLGQYGNTGVNEDGCGIIVENPEDDLFVFPFTISGEITGCGWTAFEGQVGVVALLDGNGVEVAIEPLMATSSWYASTVTFDQNMSVPILDTTDGILRFTNINSSGENPLTFDIPVVFE
jgi:hypothetical protein